MRLITPFNFSCLKPQTEPSSQPQHLGCMTILEHMEDKMRQHGCNERLVKQFHHYAKWINSKQDSIYAANLQADLEAHGYDPEHVQSVVKRMKKFLGTVAYLHNTLSVDEVILSAFCTFGILPVVVAGISVISHGMSILRGHVKADLEEFRPQEGSLGGVLSPEIAQFRDVKYLFLSKQNLEALPAQIGQLEKLTYLELRQNRLTALPAQIGQLEKLTSLELSQNRLTDLPDTLRELKELRRLNLASNSFTRVPDVLFDLHPEAEIFLVGNPLPPEEIQRVEAELARRRQAGDPQPPTIICVRRRRRGEIANPGDPLQDAARNRMNVHHAGLTKTVADRIEQLAAQFPKDLKGHKKAQRQQIREIKQRLETAFSTYGGDQAYLMKIARNNADRMFSAGLGERVGFFNDFRYSTGHVLSYVFLALERQWELTPSEHLQEAKENGIRMLIDRLHAAGDGCDTRLIEEVFQVSGAALSVYATQHSEIIGTTPIATLSRSELRDVVFPVAIKEFQKLLSGPSGSSRTEGDLQDEFVTALHAEVQRNHPNISADQLTGYLNEEILPAWDDFKEQVLELPENQGKQ
ncbi:MAG: leucine-rich repeat domain-containing protein [Burkholderiaceae bacterium]